MLKQMSCKRSEQPGENKRAEAKNNLQSEGSLNTIRVKDRAAKNSIAQSHVTETACKNDNDARKPNHSIITRSKISSHNQTGYGPATNSYPLSESGVDEVAKCLRFRNLHRLLGDNERG